MKTEKRFDTHQEGMLRWVALSGDQAMSLSERITQIQPSPTLQTDSKAKALRKAGVDVINLAAGEPDFDTPAHIKEAAIEAIREGFTKYTPVTGIEDLKEAVREKFVRDSGLHFCHEEIIVSCGAKHSLYLIDQVLLNPGDEVLIPSPCWVSYPDQVLLHGGRPVLIPTEERDGFLLHPETLRAALSPRSKMLILNSPCNPTGAAYPKERLEELAAVALERGLWIVSDEIYEKLTYDGFRSVCVAALGPEARARTITVNGLSKTYAMTGWRIGYAAGPKEVVSAMGIAQSQSTSNPTSIAQKAAVAALRGPQACVEAMAEEFDRRRRYMMDRLNRMEGVTCRVPQGAFYAFPRVDHYFGRGRQGRAIRGSVDLADYLLEEAHVALVAGAPFGDDRYLRLSYATSMEEMTKGLDRVEAALHRLR
jgi:aspartate aminotransferase